MSDNSNSRWIPLESNPEVFNSWANKAGLVASQAQFEDVYGLDEELLGMVSKPVKAVILLFPDNGELAAKRAEDDVKIEKSGQPHLDPTVFWMKQTIRNACGTMALIHALVNSDVTFVPESPLAQFIAQCQAKSPEERAKVLETTTLFADIHAESAESGQSTVPTDLHTDLHFTCFAEAPDASLRAREVAPQDEAQMEAQESAEDEIGTGTGMRLIELDGTRKGPIDRGECRDLLKDVAKVVKDEYITQSVSMHFSMLALGRPPNWD